MADRVRLFKLVQIVKSVLADGMSCQHDTPKDLPSQVGRPTQIGSINSAHFKTLAELSRVNDAKRPEFYQRSNLSQPGTQRQRPALDQGSQSQQTGVQNASRVVSGLPKPKLPLKSDIQFRPGSDSPIFKCRKILTFSDSDEDEVEKALSKPKNVAVAAVKPTAVTQIKPMQSNHKQEQETQPLKQQPSQSEPSKKPPHAFYVDFNHPNQKEPETQMERISGNDSEASQSSNLNVTNKNDSGNNSALSNQTPSLGSSKIALSNEHSRSELKSRQSYELNHSNLSADSHESRQRPSSESGLHSRSISSRSRSASPPKPVSASQNSNEHMSNDNEFYHNAYTDNHFEMISEIQQSFSRVSSMNEENVSQSSDVRNYNFKSPGHPVGAFFIDTKTETEHAYFPTFHPPKKAETRVETVVHNLEYNYGVPSQPTKSNTSPGGKTDSGLKTGIIHFTSSSQNVLRSNSHHLDERIRVCVRKRPFVKREVKRQEVDIVSVQDNDAVIVEEAKVTIDLSKYIQRVR